MMGVGGYRLLHLLPPGENLEDPGGTKIARNSFSMIRILLFLEMSQNEVVWLFQFPVRSKSDPSCLLTFDLCQQNPPIKAAFLFDLCQQNPLKQHLCQQMWV